jgi:hypothetical protein
MDEDLEAIRLRAYEIWESEGRTGNPMDHWLRAQRELRPGPAGAAASEAPSLDEPPGPTAPSAT